MIIVDTSVWIEYLRGNETVHTVWLETSINRVDVGVLDLVLCEILQGVVAAKKAECVRRQMAEFNLFDTGGEALAVASAQNYTLLRSSGSTIRHTTDCLIATFCIREGHRLLHQDRDFDPFEQHLGLQVVHPQSH